MKEEMTSSSSHHHNALLYVTFTSLLVAATTTGYACYLLYYNNHRDDDERRRNEYDTMIPRTRSRDAILNGKTVDDDDNNDDDDDSLTAHDDKEEEPIHSVLHHFASLQLDPEATVEEANKRRTASYYLKAREAHAREIVRGVPSYDQLRTLRQAHLEKTLRYSTMGTHSHRTVVVMCDASTASLLDEARRTILAPLSYSHDMNTRHVWIPALDLIPAADMHVTVAIPWWWHTMRRGAEQNYQLSAALAARFRQTLFLKFHHPFQIELQRIVLLGGQTLVALWRCVGERLTEEGHVVYDRHGECVDPFVRLRVVRWNWPCLQNDF